MAVRHKIREAARGQECQVRIPTICNFNNSTTILAHRPGGTMGRKTPDYHGAFCCSACHDVIDGRSQNYPNGTQIDIMTVRVWFLEGVFRTQEILRGMGLIKSEE